MSTVEKGTRETVMQLISMGEVIINSERGSWLSTPARDRDREGQDKRSAGSVGQKEVKGE